MLKFQIKISILIFWKQTLVVLENHPLNPIPFRNYSTIVTVDRSSTR